MCILGIDVGTTTVSAVVISLKDGEALESVTVKNDSFIQTEKKGERIQSVEKIAEKVQTIARDLTEKYYKQHTTNRILKNS